ncbi:hypothetical protein [Haloglycomyces albus]|uniref:hypothetical protein n=1 Tax=Haloglycomyces albus TaxID=526067 RepID=UPI00046CC154|nr:hypothetical protein [Haloglycomyces albus]
MRRDDVDRDDYSIAELLRTWTDKAEKVRGFSLGLVFLTAVTVIALLLTKGTTVFHVLWVSLTGLALSALVYAVGKLLALGVVLLRLYCADTMDD